MRDKLGRFVKGHTEGHRFLKKHIPWNKGKNICSNTGRTHFKKGNKGYWLGKKRSPETVEKIAMKSRGRKFSKEHKEKISKALRGRPFWGKPFEKGEKHPRWKGGQTVSTQGYVYIYQPGHPLCIKDVYVKRCILVMEKHIGRFLSSKEIVHHKGTKYPLNSIENKQDDKIKNLKLFVNNNEHAKFHYYLRKRNKSGQLVAV